MIRLLLLALPMTLAGWWLLRRLGLARPEALAGGVAASGLVLGGIVLFGDLRGTDGVLLAVALWLAVHAALFLLLRPFLGRR